MSQLRASLLSSIRTSCLVSRSAIAVGFAVMLATAACSPKGGQATSTATLAGTSEQEAPIALEEQAPQESESGEGDEREVIVVEPMRIEVIRDAYGNEQVIARDARGIFDEANDALALGDYVRAIELYDDLLLDFAESALAPPALYNAGLAFEGLGQVDAALARYKTLASRLGSGEEGIDGRVRAAALLAEHERWSEALATLEAMLDEPKLTPSNRLEAMARRGYVLLEAKDYAGGEKQLSQAITYYKDRDSKRTAFDNDYFAGMAFFYLGDIPRRQFDAIEIRLPESQMERDLETKATLVMLASQRFGDVVEFGNAYWATAAGFRLADMQREFWSALMRAPVPPHLSELAAKTYVKEVRALARSLLEKALSIHGKNVQLATLYNVPTQWSVASAAEVVRLTALIGRETSGQEPSHEEMQIPGAGGHPHPGDYIPGRVEL